jgi:hypothetical protein
MTPDARPRFLEKLDAAWRAGAFVKLTLSQYRGAEPALRRGYGRAVELREGRRLSLVWRYATRDVTKNLAIEDALAALRSTLGADWERAHLFTTTGDWQLRCDPMGHGTLKASRPTFAVAPPPEHDREKRAPIAVEKAGWLRALGVTSAGGEARPGMAPKLRQIQRFVELFGHLLPQAGLVAEHLEGGAPSPPTLADGVVHADGAATERRPPGLPLRIVDMGAGKGYLTFAVAEFLRGRGIAAEIIGVEARAELVELTNRASMAWRRCVSSRERSARGNRRRRPMCSSRCTPAIRRRTMRSPKRCVAKHHSSSPHLVATRKCGRNCNRRRCSAKCCGTASSPSVRRSW